MASEQRIGSLELRTGQSRCDGGGGDDGDGDGASQCDYRWSRQP